jgi:cytochrome b561
MQLFNSPMRYGVIAQCLHWAAVALVELAWTLGVLGDEFPEGASRALALFVHTSAGLLVIALTVLRLLWRLVDPSPPAERTELASGYSRTGLVWGQSWPTLHCMFC